MNNFKVSICGAFVGLGSYLCGLNWEIVIIWLILVIIDILTGIIKSAKVGKFSSKDMKEGLCKKIAECFLLMALILIQRVAILNGINVPVGSIFTGAFCFKEFGSILENNIELDIYIPLIVKKWFKVANEVINKDVE